MACVLEKRKDKYTLIVLKVGQQTPSVYKVYNRKSKTVAEFTRDKRILTVTTMHQSLPEPDSYNVPDWNIVRRKDIQIEHCSEEITQIVLDDICIQTGYSSKNPPRTPVGDFPTLERPLYGGRIVDVKETGDFVDIFLDNECLHYVPIHLAKEQDFSPGRYLVFLNFKHFSTIAPEVFFDYFTLT
jgi:hypothetical protein